MVTIPATTLKDFDKGLIKQKGENETEPLWLFNLNFSAFEALAVLNF